MLRCWCCGAGAAVLRCWCCGAGAAVLVLQCWCCGAGAAVLVLRCCDAGAAVLALRFWCGDTTCYHRKRRESNLNLNFVLQDRVRNCVYLLVFFLFVMRRSAKCLLRCACVSFLFSAKICAPHVAYALFCTCRALCARFPQVRNALSARHIVCFHMRLSKLYGETNSSFQRTCPLNTHEQNKNCNKGHKNHLQSYFLSCQRFRFYSPIFIFLREFCTFLKFYFLSFPFSLLCSIFFVVSVFFFFFPLFFSAVLEKLS